MSKKLIAVAAAAALALTGLVAAPANASITVVYKNAGGTTITPSATAASAAANVDVPSNNAIEYTSTSARNSAMLVTVTTVSGDVVTASSTGGIKILDDLDDATSASGSTSYTKTATTTSVEFYAFTTSTAAGSLTVSVGGNSRVVYFKGNAGPAYNIAVTAPSSVAAGLTPSSDNVTVVVTDVFGNAVENSANVVTLAVLGGAASLDDTTPDWSATKKNYGSTLTTTAAGAFALSAYITSAPTDVTGLAEAKDTYFATINSSAAEDTITALTAQVAALTAQLADSRPKATSVTKKKYNTLARKWNAAFPSQRVALKK